MPKYLPDDMQATINFEDFVKNFLKNFRKGWLDSAMYWLLGISPLNSEGDLWER